MHRGSNLQLAVEHRRESSASRQRRVAFAGWCLLALAVFFKPLLALASLSRTDLHSHCLFIPLVCAYLFRANRRKFESVGTLSPAWLPGGALLGMAIAIALSRHFVSESLALGDDGVIALLILAFVLTIICGVFLIFGTAWVWESAFPIFFLVFMVPLPEGGVLWLEGQLKLSSAEAAAWLFEIGGTPVLRDGVFFQLPGLVIQVAEECSGIRSSYVLLMTSLLASYLFLNSPWRRVLLVVAVVPLGILRNGLRIFVLGELCVRYGPHMIDTWIHHRGGPIFFVLSLPPLFILLWLLRRGESQSGASANAIETK